MAEFRAGESRVLISTDVWARGLDVPQVSLIINYWGFHSTFYFHLDHATNLRLAKWIWRVEQSPLPRMTSPTTENSTSTE